MRKFLIVDGNSLIHRAFYALPLLTNGEGEFTNAAYGFTTMFSKILAEEKPDWVVVCFDKGKITFRTEQYQEYKGHRKATPPELRPQFPLIKKILTAMNVAFEEKEGFEADDLIGTFVRQGEKEDVINLVLTGDKDALQLVSPKSVVLLTRKGISELERYDEKAVSDRFGLAPEQIIDLKGLMGDSSDNIPGVPGIGEKTALKLLQQFQTVENIYLHLNEISPKLRDKLTENQNLAILSKGLATIECCVPIEIDFNRLKYEEPDYEQLLGLYKGLEFKSLIKGILEKMATRETPPVLQENGEGEANFHRLAAPEEISRTVQEVLETGKAAIYVTHRGNYFDGDISSISFAVSESKAYTVFFDGDRDREKLMSLKELFATENIEKVVYNAKDLQVMLFQAGQELQGVCADVMLGAYLLNPGSSEYSLESLCLEYLNRALVTREDEVLDHCGRAQVVWQLAGIIEQKIADQGMKDLYDQVELPLESVLAEMEIAGVKVESSQLKNMSQELEAAVQHISREIFELAGEEFNINSPKQLGVILFEKLGLPPVKKTKTGFSTNAEVLDQLAPRHEIVAKILEHRTLVKLKSTYVDGMQILINAKTGKLHTSFNQTVTATGRLSSTEPNLQNIPIRMEMGRQIRKVFVPSREGNILLAGDYSQIELRVLAHISGDPVLKEAFQQDQDIHTRTAAEVFGVPMDAVTSEMRRRAKAVNFGIVYGISDYGLSRDLGITRKEAKRYIDSYFARYPGVADYLDRVVREARDKGYVTTLLNRRRYLPDIYSSNFNVRSFGERTAMNTPIQGSAADIIKVAMIRLSRYLHDQGSRSQMILQVHDELIFDVVPDEIDTLAKTVKELMENAVPLDVPIKVDLKRGEDWYHMTKI
ncbi:DNA polymerase I [Candidatus Formimonas warabiya]|uniref:DNA polymerase I n=1 Tax=Formimonas warabiya TaxID=1761012 RepID=UPI0011D0D5D1|nr:DNA polymerase I [Candidatus Formimonas warabiya]